MSKLKRLLGTVDSVNIFVGKAVSLLALLQVAALVYEVAARYFLGRPTIWSYELTYMIYAAHYLLGAAFCLHLKGHIRIDVIYALLPHRGQALVDCLGYLIVFFPVMIVLTISGYQLALQAYLIKEVSQYTAWTPVFWPIKTVIFVSFVLLVFQGLAEFIRRLGVLVRGVEI